MKKVYLKLTDLSTKTHIHIMHIAKPIDRFKRSLHICRQILSPYVGKTLSMLALFSWIEENIFDLNTVTRILISLLKLRRKYTGCNRRNGPDFGRVVLC